MDHQPLEKAAQEKLTQLRVEYWSKRLDHTLMHTQSASRLIYLIDGAVLALVYFFIQTLGASRQVFVLASLPMFLLVILNSLHARFIRTQHSWYRGIDEKLRDLLGVNEVQHGNQPRFLRSTHGIYRSLSDGMSTCR